MEAHDARELERALATGARLIGINNRDLRTLDVDPERAVRLRDRIPGDRLAVAESGVRDTATIARWRATGFDAALVGEALMRAADPAAAARAFVAAGRYPSDPAGDARAPRIKICGVTDAAGILAATRAGVDAIGLNFAPGTPRALTIDEGVALARLARASASGDRTRPRIVVVTANLPAARAGPCDRRGGSRRGPAQRRRAAVGRRCRRPTRLPRRCAWRRDAVADEVVATARAFLAAGATGILLDAAGGPHPGGTGIRIDAALAAAVAREVPITLAGGLDPANVGEAVLTVPAVGVDVASGTEAPRVPGERPRKDPVRRRPVRQAGPRRASPPAQRARSVPPRSTRGSCEVDAAGRWGKERDFGGRYVPETLMGALQGLESAYDEIRHDPRFWAELDDLLARFAGRPTALYRADRLAQAVALEAHRQAVAAGRRDPVIPRFRLYLKREDLAHTGAHKINNAMGQALLTRRLGKTRVIAETGAGQHGVATATACALLGLPVRRVHGRGGHPPPGAQRAPDARPGGRGPVRHVRDGDPQGRRQRGDARLGHQRRDDPLRAGLRDGPAPVPDHRARLPATDRRRGGRPAVGRRGPPARTWRSPASGAGPTPSGSSPASSASRRSAWRSPRPRATGSRPGATPPRSWAGRPGSSTAPAR